MSKVLMRLRDEAFVRRLFRVSLVLKGMFALIELVGGVLALIVPQQSIIDLVMLVTREELTEDPRDFVARHLVLAAQQLSLGSQRFAALYLLSHGLIKAVLIVGLLRDRLGFYPTAMAVFALFIAYQTFRYTLTHSAWLLAITALDVLVVALTWHEYAYLRSTQKRA